jgi:hypothetical protein
MDSMKSATPTSATTSWLDKQSSDTLIHLTLAEYGYYLPLQPTWIGNGTMNDGMAAL